ncbi:hypothetical protein SLA2020_181450 [Shorea laevis]
MLSLGMRWRVGFGLGIRLWHDVWAGNTRLLDVALNPIPQHLLQMSVSDIINQSTWQLDQLAPLLLNHVLKLIAAIPLS